MNQGALALKGKLAEHGAARALANELETDESVVSRWVNGKVKPTPENRAKLEELFGIHWRLWDQAEEPAADVA